ncbi:polymerase delta-interacting protein 3 [Portunus trituberculatus]|uniref:Polymerase delta-interacting protein 3 n=2 Tax=Portunus trituberculatus TaxID=210409 RepID=A0A5B7J5Y0_PORTR|nr:polymerase delta-interacting protein 3 [Portunus trituberculatus]
MEELFGTIGNILSARMVREGVAEAVFMNEEDAYKSVEVFNNRQLDGQPMCVSVVNKKVPVLAAAAPPQPSRTETKSVLKAAR